MSRFAADQKYQELISECDLLIKAGKISQVSGLISKLNLAQVPRLYRQQLAKTCRRVGLVSLGLRLLQPIIRQEQEKLETANASEICEYSVLLSRNGSIQEALKLLEGVDENKAPEASLYLAYCHISNWDYSLAVGLLEKFLASPADPYTKIIARVNLISAYLAISKFEEAFELLSETIPLAKNAGASRLVGNCLELRSRVHLHRGEFAKSRLDLDKALEIFGSSQVYDRLFIYKWQAVISSLELKSAEPLLLFRQEALVQRQWESVREADLFTVKVQFDQYLLDHLTYGTPLVSYRHRIQQEVVFPASETFFWGNSKARKKLNLQTGKIEGVSDFNPGKKIHQVLATLSRDFYAPRNMGTLFSELYPNEYFDINSSPLRVRQLLRRTRQWLDANHLTARIVQNKGAYRLVLGNDLGIHIPLEKPHLASNTVHWEQLKAQFPAGSSFSAKQACEKLKWPRSSFLLLIDWALKAGLLLRSGQGRSTIYCILQSSHSNAINRAA